MERTCSLLYKAAYEGNVTTLRELVQQDRLILDRLIVINNNGFSETPLHVAAMLGHVEFVKEIIIHKPELAKELDNQHFTPLHLASAKGHLETVKVLLSAVDDHDLWCYAWDGEGRNPLHLAAMRGRLDVLRELLRVAPQAARVNLNGRTETILHVCVRHNQLEALKFLMNVVDDYEFVNAKDDYGMTVLHLAVAHKHIEMVKFLLTNTKIEVNAVNANKFTALDILAQSQRTEKDFDILESLRYAGASRTIDQPPLLATQTQRTINQTHRVHHLTQNSQENKTRKPDISWLSRKRESLMVVASLIATMAFQAGTTPPGGLWQDNSSSTTAANSPSNDHLAGQSVMAYNDSDFLYHSYLISNTVGFVGSLSIILLLVTGLPFCQRFLMWVSTIILWVTLTAVTATYTIAISIAAPHNDTNIVSHVLLYFILSWAGVMVVVALLHVINIVIKILKWLANITMVRRKKFVCDDGAASL
ncbi:ankyrin repeat-containing protein NPR4-like [Humulus lupulus]|uniref:ankyrin repeat-containing protein NPR4-like n=1 Tax=Humulus lupulus TaxID=3486 RepID=UPI002B40A991|nr:ankyrin repeat-containing protein NPR4-like [Humulus lupulus]